MQHSLTTGFFPQLSVIIPTMNESRTLPELLEGLERQRQIQLEVIVCDGGSQDETAEAAKRAGVILVQSDAGRGRQMNRAADRATAAHLLFLHADSRPTSDLQLHDALEALVATCAQAASKRIAGHFRLRFRRQLKGNDLAYSYYEKKSALNRAECTNGDQGFLMPAEFFRELGGFDESLWFLEDQRLAEKIRRTGRWITLPGAMETSARRFEHEGLGRRMILSALIMNFHSIGLTEFFDRADNVYRNQENTGRLLMTPIFQLISDLNREAGIDVSRQRWRATGRYVLSHAWQPFFYLDAVVIGKLFKTSAHPLLTLHDSVFKPITRFAIFEILTAGLTWIWFLISWKVFSLLEQRGSPE
ncbi:MAG TPA: TIGR04283 family arsenosugar biosynthesis glycosyltransferase [Gammaproteobacteria bacterium]|nr:TIGR04283 family arsenosugar biosynthesis glycosyltransferase [Gammaproteobacteria bacterium]